MEACATAHDWGREIGALGHTVKLIPPIYVKPFVKRQKNDAADAEAIADAIDTVMPVYFARDMDDAVCQAASYAESDDTVLLAPACASFDQFENYGARGDAFSKAVGALSR